MSPSASNPATAPPQHATPPVRYSEPMSTPYHFPQDKLSRRLKNTNKKPLVLVACGSFSPITVLHLQLFELAQRHVEHTEFEVVGNYLSPCSDTYGKSSLVDANHRINMCSLGIEERQSNVMIDQWEARRKDSAGHPLYTPTHEVLKRLDEQINDVLGGIQTPDGKSVRAKVVLLLGADLAMTMADTKIWPTSDIDVLLGYYGAFVVERPAQCSIKRVKEALKKYQDHIWVVPSFENDVSSTRVRAQIQSGEFSEDIPRSVFEYIKLHRLYQKASLTTTNGGTN